MNFGIDFDDTISADPTMFVGLISTMQNYGHKVFIVTARCPDSKNMDIQQFCRRLKRPVEDVIYTSAKSKVATTRAMGISIDVWMDDFPELVVHDLEKARNVRSELWRDNPVSEKPQHTRMKRNPRGVRR